MLSIAKLDPGRGAASRDLFWVADASADDLVGESDATDASAGAEPRRPAASTGAVVVFAAVRRGSVSFGRRREGRGVVVAVWRDIGMTC